LFLKGAALLASSWNALGANPPSAMRMAAPGKAVIGWAQPDIRDTEGTNSWDEFETAMAANHEGLKLIYQIVDYPTLDFNLDYQAGADKTLFVTLAAEKRAAQALAAEALDNLHRGNSDSAVKNVSTMLALVNETTNDRTVISELVRIAIAQIVMPVTWELLQSTNITEAQMTNIQGCWLRLEFIRPIENALLMERTTSGITIAEWRDSSSEFQKYFNRWESIEDSVQKVTMVDRLTIKTSGLMWRYWWSYPDESRLLKGDQVLLDTVRSLQTSYSFLPAERRQAAELQNLLFRTNEETQFLGDPRELDMHSMFSSSIPSLGRILDKVVKVEVAKQMVVTAIALDWVWPRLATKDEIQAYYQKQLVS
jgi:hypothetical protein